MEVLQQITNLIPIIYKFLVITKTHLPLPLNVGVFLLSYTWWLHFGSLLQQLLPKPHK